ncbi:MAG TPA: DUF4012 domain-containing protein [Candidatus Paceibacterota bacterium]|nr:DUF4012 domain-containing protein [Candidatus Paceibacterota bacterium]
MPTRASEDIVRELRDAVATPVRAPQPPVVPLKHPFDDWADRAHSTVLRPQPRPWSGLMSLVPWFIGAGVVIVGLLYVSRYGLSVRTRAIQQGSAAMAHMVAAKDDLSSMDIAAAHTDLTAARDGFDAAGSELNLIGPTLVSLISKIPGLHAVGAGMDLINAGRALSDAGTAMTDVIGSFSGLGQTADRPGIAGVSMSTQLATLDIALARAKADIATATGLLKNVQPADVPDTMRDEFLTFRDRLPGITGLVDDADDLVAFLRLFAGEDQSRRYLILFQNSSELRPTGGFPGTYGLLTMEAGKIKDWRADDIYNPDGQIKELIVPPLQLQSITPSWGMRDAAWWADFPTSAKKVMQFWKLSGGADVDGVISIHPEVLQDILSVTGPLTVPGYSATITADNFLATLQSQVDEDRSTGQPKRIIADLAPIVLERLTSLSADNQAKLLTMLKKSLDDRDIMAYFSDPSMQQFVTKTGWSGAVLSPPGDYLMVVVSNVKGVKADAVTDTTLKLETRLVDGTLVHRLTVARTHTGGNTPYAFYNKPNHSYIRVLVPAGSTLRGITGADPAPKPIMTYGSGAVRDPDLVALESSGMESGKTSFGFWMDLDPGQTASVQLEYAVPAAAYSNDYHLYVQKQSGLRVSEFQLTIDKPGLTVTDSTPRMTPWPDSWRLFDALDSDLAVTASLE